jgi:hypothetical protein
MPNDFTGLAGIPDRQAAFERRYELSAASSEGEVHPWRLGAAHEEVG